MGEGNFCRRHLSDCNIVIEENVIELYSIIKYNLHAKARSLKFAQLWFEQKKNEELAGIQSARIHPVNPVNNSLIRQIWRRNVSVQIVHIVERWGLKLSSRMEEGLSQMDLITLLKRWTSLNDYRGSFRIFEACNASKQPRHCLPSVY